MNLSRGIAAFLGGFTVVNLVGDLLSPGFDANLWWVDLRPLPDAVAGPLLWAGAAALLAHALYPKCLLPGPPSQMRETFESGLRRTGGVIPRRAAVAVVALLVLATAWNVAHFYVLLGAGRITAAVPFPLSALVCLALAYTLVRMAKPHVPASGPAPVAAPEPTRRGRVAGAVRFAASVGACAVGFPLAQMVFFGHTDYRRPADAVVVFGARTYADGRPSDALADRVRTACHLYRQGLARTMIFSGGPGDGAVHETEAMRRMAVDLGVPDRDIVLDPAGLNTEATVDNTADRLFPALGVRRVLVVSHAYHLPRVKMAYRRDGWEAYTVPARETYMLTQMPYLMAREVVALWVYYARPLL
jgi:vancomycin permeability regulator SanA